MESATALFSLIIALPLAGFLIIGIIGLFSENFRMKKQLIGAIANLVVFIPFLIAVSFFSEHEFGHRGSGI
jgi:NADH-quinone oxidoreductase subunit L